MAQLSRPWTPASFSEVGVSRTRALASFVALTAGDPGGLRAFFDEAWAFFFGGVRAFGTPEARRDASRARLLARLDRARRNHGLDREIGPEAVAFLEGAASHWERAGNALASRTWRGQPDLRARAQAAVDAAMHDALSYRLGSPTAEGLSREEMAFRSETRARDLAALAAAIERASTALESYPRVSELPAGTPAGGAFPELQNLEALITGDAT